MLVVGKVPLFHQERRINNKNNALSLHRNELQDRVSFKKREDSFIRTLWLLCKNEGDRNLLDKLQGLAHDVDPNHPRIKATLKEIAQDSSVGNGIKDWLKEELPQIIGIGGNIIL